MVPEPIRHAMTPMGMSQMSRKKVLNRLSGLSGYSTLNVRGNDGAGGYAVLGGYGVVLSFMIRLRDGSSIPYVCYA
jgi:hypothetical protein